MSVQAVQIRGVLTLSNHLLASQPVNVVIGLAQQAIHESLKTQENGSFQFSLTIPNFSETIKAQVAFYHQHYGAETEISFQPHEQELNVQTICLTADQLASKTYLISTGKEDEERLSILNDLYNPTSLEFLKLEEGMSILTLGCGIGLLEIEMSKIIGDTGKIIATDSSLFQINLAEDKIRQAKCTNIEFRQLDVFKLEQIVQTFDRIHCRFLLSHLPWVKVQQLIPQLLSKLSPNGA